MSRSDLEQVPMDPCRTRGVDSLAVTLAGITALVAAAGANVIEVERQT